METFNVNKAAQAQKELQASKNYPDFAPISGKCWSCGKNIYEQIDHGKYKTGISVEKASTELVTGCPHCNRSYCD